MVQVVKLFLLLTILIHFIFLFFNCRYLSYLHRVPFKVYDAKQLALTGGAYRIRVTGVFLGHIKNKMCLQVSTMHREIFLDVKSYTTVVGEIEYGDSITVQGIVRSVDGIVVMSPLEYVCPNNINKVKESLNKRYMLSVIVAIVVEVIYVCYLYIV